MTAPLQRRQGVALIIALAFLVLFTIVVLCLLGGLRADRPAAASYFGRASAAQFAQLGVDQAVATLRQYTTNTSLNWISQPGQLVVANGATDGLTSKPLTQKVPLSSGAAAPATANSSLTSPALNLPTLRDPATYLISGTATQPAGTSSADWARAVSWIYKRQDGTLDTSPPGTLNLTNTKNPIVGRFAYWTDDESSKVNYNLAWTRAPENTNPVGHPTKLDLRWLLMQPGENASDSLFGNTLEPRADAIHGAITTSVNYSTLPLLFFNTPEDARRVSSASSVGAAAAAALAANAFNITHYNHDPDTTFFSQPRIVLTTQANRANGRPFLDILATPNTDPGLISSLDQSPTNNKITTVLFGPGGTASAPKTPGLVYYMSRTDWPMVTGAHSFQEKYFHGDITRLTEFAVCIIDYVRSAESTQRLVEPIRGIIISNGTFQGDWSNPSIDGAESTFKGFTRAPLITEMGMTISASQNNVNVFFEVYLPPNFGLSSVDLANDLVYIIQLNAAGVNNTPSDSWIYTSGNQNFSLQNSGGVWPAGSPTVLTPGNYQTVYFPVPLLLNATHSKPTVGSQMAMRCVLLNKATGKRYDLAPLGEPGSPSPIAALYTFTDSPTNSFKPPSQSFQSDDPRLNVLAADFGPQKASSWNQENSHAPRMTVTPPQDTYASGTVFTNSLVMPAMPAPSGTAPNPNAKVTSFFYGNPNGQVSSTGELGFIPTGIQVTSYASGARLAAGIPWRTIRLQPGSGSATVVPDWAFMDLFTVPSVVNSNAQYLYTPHGSSVGGRVSLNAQIQPFSTLTRYSPLSAALQYCQTNAADLTQTVSTSAAPLLAQNVVNLTTATTPAQGYLYNDTSGYYSPGEVSEIKGIADGGEASEELVRQVSNLLTARGDVYSIYSIGQAIRQTRTGKLVVNGEYRLQEMVERYLDTTVTPNVVRIRSVYTRNLGP